MNYLYLVGGWLAQIEPEGRPPAADDQRGGGMFGLDWFLPVMLVIIVLYFVMMMRPQQRDVARTKDMLANLKKNDRVVTAGGIIGTIVNLREEGDYVSLRVDEASNTKLQVLRSSIVRVMKDEDEAKKN